MRACVFVGSTLSTSEVHAALDAVVLGPAAEGDVARVAFSKPRAIGIIDGHAGSPAPVTHKEILWAMSQGIHVFGSAGVGALRAVELAPFGMEGVGEIYEAFLLGEIEDDDEVAVAHGPADQGYPATSEAMVDIRSTLEAAEDRGVIGSGSRDTLERTAKALHYTDRSYCMLLDRAATAGVDAAEVDGLRAFLIDGRVQQKRMDALAMLDVMRDRMAEGLEPKHVKYSLERTEAWEAVRRRVGRRPVGAGEHAAPGILALLIEEVQVAGAFGEVALGAMVRALAVETAARHGRYAQGTVLDDAIEQFRRERGLFEPVQVQRWIEQHEVEDAERFFREEAHVQWAETVFAAERARCLLDHLRSTGDYGPLLTRAKNKQETLEKRLPGPPSLVDLGMHETDLWRWYFHEHLGRAIPPNLATYARANGFADVSDLGRAVMRELAYARLAGTPLH